MKGEEVFKTIRIYAADHALISKNFPKNDNFAEIIHNILNAYIENFKKR